MCWSGVCPLFFSIEISLAVSCNCVSHNAVTGRQQGNSLFKCQTWFVFHILTMLTCSWIIQLHWLVAALTSAALQRQHCCHKAYGCSSCIRIPFGCTFHGLAAMAKWSEVPDKQVTGSAHTWVWIPLRMHSFFFWYVKTMSFCFRIRKRLLNTTCHWTNGCIALCSLKAYDSVLGC